MASESEVPNRLTNPPERAQSSRASWRVWPSSQSSSASTGTVPMRVGVKAPSPSAPMLPSTMRPWSWAETVMPPSMWATMKLQSS